MKAFGCIGFDFSMNGDGELKSNFTFKFPAKTGFYYHVPSYSPVNSIIPAIWDAKHRGGRYLRFMILYVNFNFWFIKCLSVNHTFNVMIIFHFISEELTSMVIDTNYNQWAVLTQCTKSSKTSSQHFLSTR